MSQSVSCPGVTLSDFVRRCFTQGLTQSKRYNNESAILSWQEPMSSLVLSVNMVFSCCITCMQTFTRLADICYYTDAYWYAGRSSCQHIRIPTYRHAIMKISHYTNTPLYKHSNIQTHQYTSIPIFQHTNIPEYQYITHYHHCDIVYYIVEYYLSLTIRKENGKKNIYFSL